MVRTALTSSRNHSTGRTIPARAPAGSTGRDASKAPGTWWRPVAARSPLDSLNAPGAFDVPDEPDALGRSLVTPRRYERSPPATIPSTRQPRYSRLYFLPDSARQCPPMPAGA